MKKLILLTLLTAAMAVIRLPLAAQTQQSCKSYTLSTATAGTFIQIWPNNPPDNWSAGSMSASYLPTGTVSTISVSIAVGTVSAATTSNTFLKSMSLTGTASTSTSATDMGTASDTRQFWFIYNPTFTGSGSVKVTVCFSPIAVARSGAGGGTGATGPTGPTGATGATGATGNNGTNAVAGSDTQVQFNDGGSFGASANLTFNKTSGLFGVPKLLSTSNLSNGAYIFRELRPYDYPSSPAWLESITANSSAGSTTPDHVYTAGWNLYNSGCVSSSFPGWGLSMERIWHPGGSGNAGIASITINAGGTGYTVGDYVVVVQGGSSQNGIMKVTSVSSGVVTGFNVYQAGAGYAVANGLATLPATQANSGRYNLQTGSGTGLTFDIAAIGAPTDGGLESYFAYCNAGGGYGSRPLNFEVNFATNQAAVSFLANSVIFLTEDNLAGASFNTTRGVLNSGKLTISGSAAIGGIALDVSGNSSMSGNLTVSGETTTAASSTSNAGLRLSEGVAPTSPLVGDMWLDTSGFISYRHNPGPATDKIATDNNSLIFTNKSLSAGQITPGTFGAGAYSLSGSSLTLPGSGSFDANGVLTLPTASATREYLVIGSGTKPTSPVTGGVWMANTGTYKGLGYKGPGGSTWTVPAIQDSGLVTGDQLIYNSEWQRFAGPTSSTPAILTSTGTGSAANPPAWTPAAWATTTPTGTGNLVLQTTPTLSTPSLGTNPYTATFTAGGASCCTQSQWSVQLLGTTSGASRVSQNGGTLNGLIGVSVNGNSNAGAAAEIELGGMSSVQTDGATTAGDYLIASITGNGQVHDAGSTWPTDPSKQVLGRILSTNASSGTFTALMFGPELRGIPVAASDLSNGATGSGAVVLASALPLSGTTGSIGGGLLTVGTCASGTASVTGATTSMAVSASPVTYPGDGNYWVAYVSSSNTVTVKVCATATLTPTASNYNVRVIQ